jgi:hypothetical protein
LDLYETNLTDKIFIKDSFYRIEKINEGNLIEPTLTEVSLIKERGGYYTINPPAPYYFITPNAPYPSFDDINVFTSFVSLDSFLVCNGTAPVTSLFKQGSGTFQDGTIVYTYDGTTYVPVPQGTYVRWTSSVNTYVVINNIGQIIQATC